MLNIIILRMSRMEKYFSVQTPLRNVREKKARKTCRFFLPFIPFSFQLIWCQRRLWRGSIFDYLILLESSGQDLRCIVPST